MAQAVADSTVQVLSRDDPCDRAVLGDLDPAEAQALTFDERSRDLGIARNGVNRP